MSRESDRAAVEAERRDLGLTIPAQPKGATKMAPVRFSPVPDDEPESGPEPTLPPRPQPLFSDRYEDEPPAAAPPQILNVDAFHSFQLIMRTIRKFPPQTQQEMVSLIVELIK